MIGVGALEDTASTHGVGAVVDLVGGVAIGAVVGYVGGFAVTRSRVHQWIDPGGGRIVALMLAVMAFLVARAIGVNYFVAAFVAGLAFRTGVGHDDEEVTELPELLGQVLALAVWFVFGAGLLWPGLELVDWRIAVYAVLSLTVVRMAPVAISMTGAGYGRPATAFIGWFGPRGLASVVFGLLIIEELPADDPRVQTVLVHDRAHRPAQCVRPRNQRPTTDRMDAPTANTGRRHGRRRHADQAPATVRPPRLRWSGPALVRGVRGRPCPPGNVSAG